MWGRCFEVVGGCVWVLEKKGIFEVLVGVGRGGAKKGKSL